MALDGALLRQIKHELEGCLIGSRVDKIHQFSREEMVFVLRLREPAADGARSAKLYLSAGADSPRLHLTSSSFENPKSPPMFCMLMRKHLGSAKLLEIRQVGLDRILHLIFETRNEMGDLIELTVAIEIMGRHSNIILIDENGRVIDSIKRIDDTMSSVRPILPGVRYTLPPAQDKLDLITSTPEQIEQRLIEGKDTPLSKALLAAVQGVSPIVCREVANYVFVGDDRVISEMTPDHFDRLRFFLSRVILMARDYTGTPTSVIDSRKKPMDFSFLDIHQYGGSMFTRTYDSYSQLLDDFYTQRDNIQRMRHRSSDLLKVLANTADRIARKLSLQQKELADCSDRETWKIYGDLISANLYSIQKGDRTARLINFYDEAQSEVVIPLDPRKTPAQNAQKYYGEYRKADTAEKKLRELIEEGQQEAVYIDSVFDALTRAQTNDELTAIRAELAEQGYLRKKGSAAKKGKEPKLAPKRYRSDDGFTILVGRNNVQNDQLTLKEARGRDYWFHTKNIPGSHTIVVSDGQEVPDSTLHQAAILAAVNSKAAESSQVPVDYTLIKNVKKPRGAKPGMVIYVSYQTAYVTPDLELEKRLAID
ncbi:MAG: NFACT RNA binding domain-containing protein [Negativibacillus sp.]|nr:NFACT RNA binding domain-containing protein [Negativibacillus sp.]